MDNPVCQLPGPQGGSIANLWHLQNTQKNIHSLIFPKITLRTN